KIGHLEPSATPEKEERAIVSIVEVGRVLDVNSDPPEVDARGGECAPRRVYQSLLLDNELDSHERAHRHNLLCRDVVMAWFAGPDHPYRIMGTKFGRKGERFG